MKLVIESLAALMVVIALGAVVVIHRAGTVDSTKEAFVQESLARLAERTAYHAAMAAAEAETDADLKRAVRLQQIDPQWFGGDLPLNVLLEGDRPWIDVAPAGDLRDHPPDPIARTLEQAGFWYNPTLGIFRARVAPQLTDAAEIELYNRLNHSELEDLVFDPDPLRSPLAHEMPGQTNSPLHTTGSVTTDHVQPMPLPSAPAEPEPRRTLRSRS